jgi:hypothetical protein
MSKTNCITQEELKKVLTYNFKTGEFFRNGKLVGFKRNTGYICIKINNRGYQAHRLAWLYVHGKMPSNCIDHINNDKTDNRIENLREANASQNNHNSRLRKDNNSGVKGVYWSKQHNKWRVQIGVNGKNKYFGLHDDLELAELVAQEARNEYHKEFANHG